ncbi:MAG: hypothetical protein ABJA37_15880 [Ferruginibacter sp.]
MKKSLLIAIAFSYIMIVSLTNCKKDTNNPNSNISTDSTNTSIVGTWEQTYSHEVDVDSTTTPISTITSGSNFVHNKAPILKFNSDYYCFSQPQYEYPLNNILGSYRFIGNDTISIVFGPGPPPEKAQYIIKGTTLTLFYAPHYLYDSLHFYLFTKKFTRLL